MLFRVTLALSNCASTTFLCSSKNEQSNLIKISDSLNLDPSSIGIDSTFAASSLESVASSVAVTKTRVESVSYTHLRAHET